MPFMKRCYFEELKYFKNYIFFIASHKIPCSYLVLMPSLINCNVNRHKNKRNDKFGKSFRVTRSLCSVSVPGYKDLAN